MAVSEKTKAIDQAILQIEKQFGKGSIMKLGTTSGEPVDAIPSGSIALDLALGIGGFPPRPAVWVFRPGAPPQKTATPHPHSPGPKNGGPDARTLAGARPHS